MTTKAIIYQIMGVACICAHVYSSSMHVQKVGPMPLTLESMVNAHASILIYNIYNFKDGVHCSAGMEVSRTEAGLET